ncbi:MAG: TIGR02996 domain-containing protein [Fimbriiglobus sp.]
MNEDRAFLNAILANPQDRLLRLVYADWLEERGDPRSEYLRVACRLAEISEDCEERQSLQERVASLRAELPANWLAALDGPIWCVVANVLLERNSGPGGAEIRRGTKHFAPGSKVYVFYFYWGSGGDRVTVVGRHRKTKKYMTLITNSEYLANWRAELVYAPEVIRRITESSYEFSHFPRGEAESKARAEEIVAMYLQGGAVTQPYISRQKSTDSSIFPEDG